jgi:hypothetical protein
VSHKRYQNPQKGYSRRQQKSMVGLAIEEELAFDEQIARTRFEEESITSLMADPGTPPAAPPPEAPTPQAAIPEPQAVPADPAPRAATVHRGAFGAVDHPTNDKIRLLDRLLAVIRRGR